MTTPIETTEETIIEVLQTHYPDVWQEIAEKKLYVPSINMMKLVKRLRDYFSESEIKDFCLSLKIEYKNLEGDTFNDKTRELVVHCKRRNLLGELVKLCKKERPMLVWGQVISD